MIKKDLFDTNASLFVLSCLMRDPLLLQNDKYSFVKTDFYKPLQQIVFYAIYNMSQNGIGKIVPQDIDLYLSQYSSQYEYYKANKGYEFVSQCYQTAEGSDLKQFDFYYNRIKKFAVLRDLESIGINTDQFYDTNKDALNRDAEDEKLNRLTIEQILNVVRGDIVDIENKHVGKDQSNAKNAAEGMRNLVKELQDNPEVGLPLEGEIVNYACSGGRLGKLYTYSAPSGAGKAIPNDTIIPMADGSFKRVGDVKKGDFLIDRRGRLTQVLQVFPQGEKELYKVTFKDKRVAYCNDEHLWTYHYYGDKNYDSLQTSTLRELIDMGIEQDGQYNFGVPINEPVRYSYKDLIDPYTYGLLIANQGKQYSKEPRISKKDMCSSINQRISLLQGIFDISATVNKRGDIVFKSKDYILTKEVQKICWSLGLLAILKRPKETDMIALLIKGSSKMKTQLFRNSSNQLKINKICNSKDYKESDIYNPIVKVECMNKKVEMTCFMVDNKEHLFLMNDYIVTHNTRYMVENACAISLPYIDNSGNVVLRGTEKQTDYQKTLFVTTEQQPDEIQTMILAHVSGVNEKTILLGNYSFEELDRIKRALDIIDKYGSNFIIECIPDPSIAMIKARLTKYIVQDNVEYIFYDYIFSSPGLLSEFRDVAVREDRQEVYVLI